VDEMCPSPMTLAPMVLLIGSNRTRRKMPHFRSDEVNRKCLCLVCLGKIAKQFASRGGLDTGFAQGDSRGRAIISIPVPLRNFNALATTSPGGAVSSVASG
jgi:hypothetical protein